MISTAVSDEALMIRTQDDDVQAFAELYVRHADGALHVAAEIVADPSGAEDVVQEGFLSIWRSRADYRPQLGSFEAWSMRIVHNRAVDAIRTVRVKPRLQGAERDDEPDGDGDAPFERAVADLEHLRLFEALRRLPVSQTEVIVLAYYGDLSLSEIATRLGVPPGTVKGRMRLGLEKLRGDWTANERNARHL